jgi:uncharacterized protein (DUF608 family)
VIHVSEESGCGCGRKTCSPGVTRRDFLRTLGAGALGASVAGASVLAAAEPLGPPRLGRLRRFPLTPPRVYSGEHLSAVAMPIGGIGTGSIWLDGEGKLGVWQVCNNLSETRIPDSFFAVRAQADGGVPVTRVLQTSAERGFAPLASLSYEGGYPIARLSFDDPELPVGVQLAALNPLIPTDTASSALPCAIFRLTARNAGRTAVSVSLLGTLQNAVGSQGRGGIDGVRFADYGANENRLVRERGMTAGFLTRTVEPLPPGVVRLKGKAGFVDAPRMLWLPELGGLTETAQAGPTAAAAVGLMADVAANGGVILVGNTRPEFFRAILDVRRQMAGWDRMTVFEDFEDGTYDRWTVKGEAFGRAPHTGTSASQQPVSGFMGQRLVNSFVPNDGPQGELISRPFKVERKYIGFLIGGGDHPGETCMNLVVEGKVVRTATGRNLELLEPRSWEVSEFLGREAHLEIIDHHSGGWGHINLDQIVFADAPPEDLLKLRGPLQMIAQELELTFDGAESANQEAPTLGDWKIGPPPTGEWRVTERVQLSNLKGPSFLPDRLQILDRAGHDLLLVTRLGQATMLLSLAPGLPWAWAERCLLAGLGREPAEAEVIVTTDPGFGSLALATTADNVTCDLGWTDGEALAKALTEDGKLTGPEQAGPTAPGQTANSALCATFRLQPGQERTLSFVVAWHFPNVDRFGHFGNQYSQRFGDALAVARHVCENLEPLWTRTELYQQTVYESNLPEEFLDACTSQSVIFRGPTAWWDEAGYFAGFEGSYGCCPLNCTHVWNYAQSHARLFPELDRNLRYSDLVTFLHPDGETSHRQHAPHNAFIDGHCAVIEGALRAHQLSPDNRFLEQVWPNLVQAVDWLVEAIDPTHEGIPTGHQWNTYDCAVAGPNTFIGSQYLSALAAAERLAQVMGDEEAGRRWAAVRAAGMTNQNVRLWNGEYYIQTPTQPAANDYNTGCHSDQLLGQWWAHMLDLGYLYPPERVRQALEAVNRHNYLERFAGFRQAPRRYVTDEEAGLLMCTWPQGGRPDPFIIYADEVWTGIEYSTAGLMIYEGMVDEARRIVRTARSRYDGRLREDLNSGPGGNPFNELECGKFYARAMSAWGLLIASQGLVLDGPAGVIGFRPRWQPEDHRSFFTAPEGWGLFVQTRSADEQTELIQVRHGHLSVQELVFETPDGNPILPPQVRIAGRAVKATPAQVGREVRLRLPERMSVLEGQAIDVSFRSA